MGWRQHLYDPPTIFLLSAMSGWCVLFGPLRFPVLSTLVFRGDFVYLRWCCHLSSRDFTSHDSNERDDGLKARYYRVSTKSCICPAQIQGREKKSLEFEQIELFGEKKSQPWFGYVICLSCSDLFFLQVGLRPLVKSYHRVGGPSEPNEIEIIIKKNI